MQDRVGLQHHEQKEVKMAKKNMQEEFSDLFGDELPVEQRMKVEADFPVVVSNVTARIKHRCGIEFMEAQDLAFAAACYALRSYITGSRPWPNAIDDWERLAAWKGIRLGFDLHDKMSRTQNIALDREVVTSEGDVLEDSPTVVEISMRAWQTEVEDEEARLRGAAVRYALRKVVRDMKTKNPQLTLAVTWHVYIAGMPIPEVCAQVKGLKRNYVYQILLRFRDRFAELGPNYMDEYMEYYADRLSA